jgi:hypothetical protein
VQPICEAASGQNIYKEKMIFNLLNLIFKKDNSLSYNNSIVFTTAKVLGYSNTYAAYLTAQADFESANFQSSLYQRSFNAFGMRPAKVREKSQIEGDNNNYATYTNLFQSVYDRYLWDKYNNIDIKGNQSLLKWSETIRAKGYYEASLTSYTAGVVSKFTALEDSIKLGWVKLFMTLFFRVAIVVGLFILIKWKK